MTLPKRLNATTLFSPDANVRIGVEQPPVVFVHQAAENPHMTILLDSVGTFIRASMVKKFGSVVDVSPIGYDNIFAGVNSGTDIDEDKLEELFTGVRIIDRRTKPSWLRNN